jgi:hypothetical protein
MDSDLGRILYCLVRRRQAMTVYVIQTYENVNGVYQWRDASIFRFRLHAERQLSLCSRLRKQARLELRHLPALPPFEAEFEQSQYPL